MVRIPLIISLSGRKGSGKNTAAEHLVNTYNYREVAWADALRQEVIKDLVDIENHNLIIRPIYIIDWLYDSMKEKHISINIVDYVYSKPTPPTLRKLLQLYGTEFRRAQDPAYWLKKLHLEPGVKYCVTDTRFQNEVDLLTVFGSLNIMVKPYGFPEQEQDSHVSEKMELTKMDYEVANIYGDPTDMFKQLDCIIETVESHNIEKLALIEWNKNAD